jgi:molybdenum cofactor cytidylyltransferase
MHNVALILLAAGASKRLGQPKQLLQFHGRSLLRHAAETALESDCRPVIVVLRDRLENELFNFPLITLKNQDRDEGIASSIRLGVSAVPESASGTVIMLVDQPLVSATFLNALASSDNLAAAKYNDSLGVPAYFPRKYFPELLALKGDKGAKSILEKHNTFAITCDDAAIDIDTAIDAENLTKLQAAWPLFSA